MHTVAVVIVSYNTREVLRRCLAALAASNGVSMECIVVDNGSHDGSANMVADDFPDVHLVRNTINRGFAAATNQGVYLALNMTTRPDYVLLLNSDAFVEPNTLVTLLRYAEQHPHIGVVAPQLRNLDGSLQPTGRPFPTVRSKLSDLSGWSQRNGRNNYFVAGRDYAATTLVDEVPAACLLVRRMVFEQVGSFDEAFRFNYEDTDWCRRVATAGWPIVYLPAAQVTHIWGASQREVRPPVELESRRGLVRYFRKHGAWWQWLLLSIALLVFDTAAIVRCCFHTLVQPMAREQLQARLAWRLRAMIAVLSPGELNI